jgi:hypothetical protein
MIDARRLRKDARRSAVAICVLGVFFIGTLLVSWPLVSELAAYGADGQAVTLAPERFDSLVEALRAFSISYAVLGGALLLIAWQVWRLAPPREPDTA